MRKKSPDKLSDHPLEGNLMDYARQIWLAGLGAFAKAEQEGSRWFETLVKRGEEVEIQFRKTAEGQVNALRSRAEEARDKANDTWNKLEQVFQKRVARALTRLGVPTREDVQGLVQQVEALQNSIQALGQAEQPALPETTTGDSAAAVQ